MQSTEFERCLEDVTSSNPDVKQLAVQQLHVLMFGQGVLDPVQARAALRGAAERLAEAMKEPKGDPAEKTVP